MPDEHQLLLNPVVAAHVIAAFKKYKPATVYTGGKKASEHGFSVDSKWKQIQSAAATSLQAEKREFLLLLFCERFDDNYCF